MCSRVCDILIPGHSLGAARIQAYSNNTGNNVTGQVLYAATLMRMYNNLSYPTPTLSVGGEKDGMTRLTRLAEALYVYRSQPHKFPVVAIPGANHMNFASGAPPLAVAMRDLRAEVNEATAHASIAQATADFIRSQAGGSADTMQRGRKGLQRLRDESTPLLSPLVDALLLEGSHHLQRPCNSDHPSPHCPWYAPIY